MAYEHEGADVSECVCCVCSEITKWIISDRGSFFQNSCYGLRGILVVFVNVTSKNKDIFNKRLNRKSK